MEIAHKLPTSTHKSENCQSLAEHESMAGLVSKETVEWKGGGGGGGGTGYYEKIWFYQLS